MAAPPANALIGNQATASYFDGNGASQSATSNLVQTQVQQVGSFTLDGIDRPLNTIVNTKTGAAGNTVYAPHILTNTGNGTDMFDIVVSGGPNGAPNVLPVAVYLDADGNGLPDSTTALCSVPAGSLCTVPTQAVAGNGGVFKFVVAYAIPASATVPLTPYSSAKLTATPVTTGRYTAPNTAASDVDNINLTTVAAFNATLSLAVPTVSGPGGSTYPAATQSGKRSTGTCTADYASAQTPAPGCVYTTYTLNFSNTGGAAGVFYTNNVLPVGFTYVTGSAVWSGASGQALSETGADPTGIDFAQGGQTISARVLNVNPNVAGSISFMVLVRNTAAIGTGDTSDTATYDSVTSTHATADSLPGSSRTNIAAFTVTPTYAVVLGSNVGTADSSVDTTAGTPLGNFGTAGPDQTVVASTTSGSAVNFTQTVLNTGSAPDSFNMTYSPGGFPAGTTFTFFKEDGLTPLLDTNGDGIVDTGIIAAGGAFKVVMQARIGSSVAAGTGPFTTTVRATSVGDPTKFDATGDQVTAVTGIAVDLTNSSGGTGSGSVGAGDLGAGPSPDSSQTLSTSAGTGTTFTLFIKNNGTGTDTSYNLAASQTSSFPGSLPTGWTVKFVAAGGTCAATAVTTPVTVANGAQLQINACVTPSASAAPGTTSVYFRVSSSTTASNDSVHNALTVTAAASYMATLTPNQTGQVVPGGTVVYAHTLNNTGTQACGAYTLATAGSGAAAGWTYTIYKDNNNDGVIDALDTLVTSGASLDAGTSVKYLVRVFAPGGTTAGQSDSVTFTATFAAGATSCGTPSATDISTVAAGGQVRAVKMQALNASCSGTPDTAFRAELLANVKPGQCLIYQVTATNEGTAAVTQLKINDAVPNYTTLTGATQPPSPIVQCAASAGVTGTLAFDATSVTTVSCGTATSVPPGGTLTLTFAVRIAP